MYILQCADGSYYTGSTKDLEKRLAEHQNGEGANHTKKRLPVELLYYEKYDRIDTAFYREKQVQGWSRAKKEALMRGEVEALPGLSIAYRDKVVSRTSTTDKKFIERKENKETISRVTETTPTKVTEALEVTGLRLADAEPCRSTDLGENKANPEPAGFDSADTELAEVQPSKQIPNPERSRRMVTENETNQPPQTP